VDLTLEPVDLEHAASVQELASDPLIGETTSLPSPYPPDGAETFIREVLEKRAEETDFVFAILDEGRVAGMCGLTRKEGDAPTAEMGYWIGRPFWGRGLATAAAGRLLEFGFEALGLERVQAWCVERNPGSVRVLEKLGFHSVPGERPEESKWGPEEPFLFFELDREIWKSGLG